MKCLTTLAFAAALLFTTASTQALLIVPNYTLTYDPADGSLTIDPLGDPLFTYSVKTLTAPGGDDGFIEGNHVLLPDAPGGLTSPANTSTDDELSQSDFDGWTGLGPFSLGNVLPSGLTESQLNSLLDTSTQNTFYVDALGALNDPGTFKSFDVVFVPEPGSFVIFSIGAALLAQRRRKR